MKPIILRSRPARGGWIEIEQRFSLVMSSSGPAPHGAGGLKFIGASPLYGEMMVPPRTGRVD